MGHPLSGRLAVLTLTAKTRLANMSLERLPTWLSESAAYRPSQLAISARRPSARLVAACPIPPNPLPNPESNCAHGEQARVALPCWLVWEATK